MIPPIPKERRIREHQGGQPLLPVGGVVRKVDAHDAAGGVDGPDGDLAPTQGRLGLAHLPAIAPAAHEGEEVAFVWVDPIQAQEGVVLATGGVVEGAEHLQGQDEAHGQAAGLEGLGVDPAAHLLRAEVGRLIQGPGDKLYRGGRRVLARDLQEHGHAAGVVIGAGQAQAGVVVGADDQQAGAALRGLGAEAGHQVRHGPAPHRVGLTLHATAGSLEVPLDVGGGGVQGLRMDQLPGPAGHQGAHVGLQAGWIAGGALQRLPAHQQGLGGVPEHQREQAGHEAQRDDLRRGQGFRDAVLPGHVAPGVGAIEPYRGLTWIGQISQGVFNRMNRMQTRHSGF